MNSKFSLVLVVFLTLSTHSIFAANLRTNSPGVFYSMGNGYGESHMSKQVAEIAIQIETVKAEIETKVSEKNRLDKDKDKDLINELEKHINELTKQKKVLADAKLKSVKAMAKSADRLASKGSPENAIIMMVNKMDDFAETMAGVDWTSDDWDGELKDKPNMVSRYGGYIFKAAAIRACAGIATRFGDELDEKVGNIVTPFFTKVSNAFKRIYRFIFKNNKDPLLHKKLSTGATV